MQFCNIERETLVENKFKTQKFDFQLRKSRSNNLKLIFNFRTTSFEVTNSSLSTIFVSR